MRLKNGYRKDKPRPFIGKWLKRYFEKRSCRKSKIYFDDEIMNLEHKPMDMPVFSEGVRGGATILMDGKQLSTEQTLNLLRRGANAERIVREIWDMFYGQNMRLTNYHYNGDTEPIDIFFHENDWKIDV